MALENSTFNGWQKRIIEYPHEKIAGIMAESIPDMQFEGFQAYVELIGANTGETEEARQSDTITFINKTNPLLQRNNTVAALNLSILALDNTDAFEAIELIRTLRKRDLFSAIRLTLLFEVFKESYRNNTALETLGIEP